MNSRNLLNLALAIILAVLVVIVFFQPGKEKKEQAETLTSLTPSDIQSIVIDQVNEQKIILQKTNDKWQVTQPLSVAANTPLVENILNITKARSHASYTITDINLGQLKLEKPSLVLYLNDQKLEFGDTDALRGYRYVLTNNRIYLITDRYSHLLRQKYTALVSPALLPGNINIIKLVLPEMMIVEGKNGWTTTPEQTIKSADQLQGLIDEWRFAQAMKITQLSDCEKQENKKNATTIEVHSSNFDTLHFTLYTNDDEIMLGRPDSGLCYHFEKKAGGRLISLNDVSTKPQDTD